MTDEPQCIARAVREACLVAAQTAYDDAAMGGLCEDGRWECAYQAIKQLDLDAVLAQLSKRG